MVDTTPTPVCPNCGTPNRARARYCDECGVCISDPGDDTTLSLERRAKEELERLVREATAGVYDVERELGRGGMAAVYLATEIALNRKVAIKILPPEFTFGEGMTERFEREARTAAQLDHPNIIPIYRVDSAGRLLYFSMKYVEGRSLADILLHRGALPIPTVTGVLEAVGSALAYAHERGVIHRDIKPGNILIDRQGVVLVSDFGIAKTTQEATITKSGGVIGTPQYMSPEQCLGKRLTPASDQYSLGVVGFEMLSGKVPFEADSAVALLQKHISEPPPPLAPLRPDAPPELVRLIERTMRKAIEERFPTIGELAEAVEMMRIAEQHAPQGRAELKALAVGDTIKGLEVVTPISGAPQVAEHRKTPRVRGSMIGVAAAAVAAIGIWQLAVRGPDDPQPTPAIAIGEESEVPDDTTATARDSAAMEDSAAPTSAEDAEDAGVVVGPPEPERDTAPPAVVTPPQPPRPATMILQGIPEQAVVIVDSELRQGRRISLTPGEHTIVIQAQGYREFEATLVLREGQTRTYSPQLTQLPREFGRLRVGSMPAGILFVDHVEIGELPVLDFQIATGNRRIRIEAPGCTPYDTTITVQVNTVVSLGLVPLNCGGRR